MGYCKYDRELKKEIITDNYPISVIDGIVLFPSEALFFAELMLREDQVLISG